MKRNPCSYCRNLDGISGVLKDKVIVGSDINSFISCCFILNHIFYENGLLYIF